LKRFLFCHRTKENRRERIHHQRNNQDQMTKIKNLLLFPLSALRFGGRKGFYLLRLLLPRWYDALGLTARKSD
jgi:hypothetical protein